MVQTVCILGRQPALGLAELESLFGAEAIQKIGDTAALLNVEPGTVTFERLGGTVKLAKLLTILDTTDWNKIENYLISSVIPHTKYLPEGKMNLGLSVYGFPVKPSRINATALELKKAIKQHGRSVRVIPNKTSDLSSAQVLHNDLVGPRSWELLLIAHGNKTYLAQTIRVQDINAYAARDQRRPKRDAKVGMLPPKLAQIIINLAHPQAGATVVDPFCGTGVILQEAALMGFNVYGTDLETRMVEYSEANLEWLNMTAVEQNVQQGDATTFQWDFPPLSVIAAETYLGRPFSALPKPEVLSQVMQDVDTIHKKFLENVAKQTKAGFRLAIAIPAWKTNTGFKHLKVLDSLTNLGYTRQSFVHVRDKDLVYHRPDQIVARELVVLMRK